MTGCDLHQMRVVAECLVEEKDQRHKGICSDHQICSRSECETELMVDRTPILAKTA